MSEIIKTLNFFKNFTASNPAGESEITKAETALGLCFAPEYREYISLYGAASANGHELTGIINSSYLNVTEATKEAWEINPDVPRTMYVIEDAAIDGIIIWQDSSGKVYQSSPNFAPHEIASSLAVYLTL